MGTLRCVLMGSESLLVQCAEILRERGHSIEAIVTRDSGIRAWADSRSIRVIEPGRGLADRLRDTPHDWFFSIANLTIIPKDVLALPSQGAINFHDGALPRFAGLNCPVWTIARQEPSHGITWHLIEGGIDEGDILAQRVFDVTPSETALTLNTRCYEAGIESFAALVSNLENGRLERKKQDLAGRVYFGKHDRPEGAAVLDLTRPARELDALVRALDHGTYRNPVITAKVRIPGGDYILVSGVSLDEESPGKPGTIASLTGGLSVHAQEGTLRFGKMLDADGGLVTETCLTHRFHLEEGMALPPQTTAERERWTNKARELAKGEDFFAARLVDVSPVELPGASAREDKATFVRFPLTIADLDPARTTALLGAFLARTTGRARIELGYRSAKVVALSSEDRGLVADVVPLRLELGPETTLNALEASVRDEREKLDKHGTYLRDLIARVPGAVKPRFDVIVEELSSLDGDVIGEAPALCIRMADGRAEIMFDGTRVPEVVRRDFVSRLGVFATNAIAAPDAALSRLSMLTNEERKRILTSWNATETSYAHACVHELFEQQVDRTPDATALVFEGDSLSYRELDERANQLAHRLRSLGVKADTLVGLSTPRSLDLVIGALAIQKAGGAYVPLDPSYPKDRIGLMIEDSRVAVIVSVEHVARELPPGTATIVRLDTDRGSIAGEPKSRPSPLATPENLAYVIYTSGSTGKPKGVMVEHRNVSNFFTGMDARVSHEPGSSWLAVTSLSFDISVLELFWTLARGFKLVIASDSDRALVSSSSGGVLAHQTKPIELSLYYFASDEGENTADKYKLLLDGARFADENGFLAVWTPERHFHAFGGLYPNPSVASAALSTITKRIGLRAGSCVSPLHHPVRITEEWSLVDNLSNGRVGISFAAGWHPNDFIFNPQKFARAKEQMFEDIETIRRLWRGETIEFDGPRGKVAVRTLPRPVQKELPVWVTTAGNPETFAQAGKVGAYILTHLLGQTLEEVRIKIESYRKGWREAGHLGDGYVTLMLHTLVGDNDDEVRELVREPMKGYLRTALSLLKKDAWVFPAFKRSANPDASFEDNFAALTTEDAEALLDHAFERYFASSGLFGTVETCLRQIDGCKGIGVDEVACLIDYGVDSRTVKEHFAQLLELKKAAEPKPIEVREGDYSLAAQLVRHRITHLQCTPSMARMLLMNDESRAALRGLKEMMVGGEALPGALATELLRAVGGKVTNMYGPTETTIWSSTERVAPTEGTVSIGTPIANTQLYVLDAHREPVPVGVPGELYIGGVGVTRGYLYRPDLTKERFLDDPFRAGNRIYRTGDLVRFMPDGRIDFLGRVDHQVKIRGYRIELGEIETQIDAHPGVRESVVIAREDKPGDKRLVAYFVGKPGMDVDVKRLRAELEAKLPDYMVPSHFLEMARFPLTPNAKVDRKQLPKPDDSRQRISGEFVMATSGTEQKIADIWQRILGVSRVSATDNFFELGGHSLLAVQAHREIKAALSHPSLSITDIFRFPTLRALSNHVEGGSSGEALERGADRAAARRDAMSKRLDARKRPR